MGKILNQKQVEKTDIIQRLRFNKSRLDSIRQELEFNKKNLEKQLNMIKKDLFQDVIKKSVLSASFNFKKDKDIADKIINLEKEILTDIDFNLLKPFNKANRNIIKTIGLYVKLIERVKLDF